MLIEEGNTKHKRFERTLILIKQCKMCTFSEREKHLFFKQQTEKRIHQLKAKKKKKKKLPSTKHK